MKLVTVVPYGVSEQAARIPQFHVNQLGYITIPTGVSLTVPLTIASQLTVGDYPWPSEDGVELEIGSTSDEDQVGGSGAFYSFADVLDIDGKHHNVEIPLTGTTYQDITIPSGSKFTRIQGGYVCASENAMPPYWGENYTTNPRASNIGIIRIRDKNNPSKIYAQIDAGEGRSRQAIWSCPAGTTGAYLTNIRLSMIGLKPIDGVSFALYRRLHRSPWQEIDMDNVQSSGNSASVIDFPIAVYIPPRGDIKLTVESVGAGNGNQSVAATMSIIAG